MKLLITTDDGRVLGKIEKIDSFSLINKTTREAIMKKVSEIILRMKDTVPSMPAVSPPNHL